MANTKIDFSGITAYIPEAVRELKDLIKEHAFEHPMVTNYVTIVDGIEHDKKIGYYGSLGTIGMKANTSSCTLNEVNASIDTDEKTWEPEKWDTRLAMCADDIADTVAAKALNKGIKRYDMTETEYMDLILVLLEEAIAEMYARLVWIADSDAALTTDSPDGYITSTKDVDFVKVNDGLFKRAYDIIAADSSQRVSIATENGQATYALQRSSMTAANALTYVRNLQYNATMAMRQDIAKGGYEIHCTQMLFDKVSSNWKGFDLESMKVTLENGLTGLKIDGVPVIARPDWDALIQEWEDNGSSWRDPYRALLFKKENALAGVPSIAEWGSFEIFYDPKDKKVYIDMEDKLDTQFVQDTLIMFAV